MYNVYIYIYIVYVYTLCMYIYMLSLYILYIYCITYQYTIYRYTYINYTDMCTHICIYIYTCMPMFPKLEPQPNSPSKLLMAGRIGHGGRAPGHRALLWWHQICCGRRALKRQEMLMDLEGWFHQLQFGKMVWMVLTDGYSLIHGNRCPNSSPLTRL